MRRNRVAPRNRRRKLLVSNSVQLALVRQSLWHWLLYCSTTVFLLGLLHVLFAGPAKPLAEHCQALSQMFLTVFLSLVLLLPKFIYDWLKVSHRFAGPVEKLRRVLRGLANEEAYATVQFRKDDFWQQMADELNSAVEALTEDNLQDTTVVALADEDTPRKAEEITAATA